MLACQDFTEGCTISEEKPIGLIHLETICVLEATFSTRHFDGFFVHDSTALENAIAVVSPYCASRMKKDLHMTVRYPGVRRVPGVSCEDAEAYGQGSSFPPIRILIRDIYVSKDRALAAAVVYGVDTAVSAMTEATDINGKTPAHLTLWAHGRAPVEAGRQLIGLELETREPFVQVTQDCLRNFVKSQAKIIAEKASKLQTIQREHGLLLKNVTVLEGLIRVRVVTIQRVVRCWRARTLTSRMRKMRSLTQAQRQLLIKVARGWLARWKTKYYRDYDSGDEWY